MYAKARKRVSKGFTKVGAFILVFALVFSQFAYSVNAAVQDPATDYVALGDSISFGIGASQPANSYVNSFYNYLRALPGNEGMVLKNLSVSGHTTSMLKNVLADDYTQMALANAKVVTVSIGGNNLLGPIITKIHKYAGVSIDDPNLRQRILAIFEDKDKFNLYSGIITSELNAGVQKFEQEWPEIALSIKTLAPSADLYAMTVYNPFEKGDIFYNMVDPFIQKINYTINTTATGYKVADVYTAFNNDTSGLALTGIEAFDPHPTDKGHEIIFNAHVDAYNFQQPSPTPEVTTAPTEEIATATPVPYSFNGEGLTGLYFNDRESVELKFIRLDSTIDLYGYGELPSPSIGKNPFSICWAGQIQPKYSGTYTLYTDSDCCVHLWVDGQVLIDDFECKEHDTGHNSATIEFEAGKKYDIVLTYADSDYFANMRLSWSSASQGKEVVPKECLYPMEFIDMAYLLVGLAAIEETQKCINQAASVVSQLPEGPEKTLLAEELNNVQMSVYAAAIGLVEEAENNICQLNYDIAAKFVNTLPQGLIKSVLSGRLQLVKDAVDAQFKGTGLLCELFKGTELDNLGAAWIDRVFTLDWGSDLPEFIGNDEGISMRWCGQIQPRYSDTYTFYLTAVGGQRLLIDGQLIIDSWEHGNGTVSGQITLEAGRKYDIKVEYFEETGSPMLCMEWESQNQNRDIVNKESLYPADITTDATALVNSAEILITQESVNYALKALAFVTDEAIKNSLTIRLSAVQYILNSNAALVVGKAEHDKTQESVNEAMDMVNALNDGELKSALLERLNAVQDIINAAVTALVEKAETDKTKQSFIEAKNAVGSLASSEVKTALVTRLSALEPVIFPTLGYVDQPKDNTLITGVYKFNGWFLDISGVEKIEVLADDVVIGEAVYGISRQDVFNKYPEYENDKAGFQYDFDSSLLSEGTHMIKFRETGKNGSQKVLQAKKIIVSRLPVRGWLDVPDNYTFTDNSTISGWILDSSGVAKIEVLVDDVVVGEAEYGFPRPDVLTAYPDYNNAKAGFKYNLDVSKLSDGKHVVKIRETGLNGGQTVLQSKAVFVKVPAVGYIDFPINMAVLSGQINVHGWFLDRSGVAKIEVLVDDVVVGEAVYGSSMPDVMNVYPLYNNSNAGYQYMLDTTLLTEGPHTIKIRETGNNGETTTLNAKDFIVSRLPVRGHLDMPAGTVTGTTKVSGWVLDGSGVTKVEILVDGVVVGEAVYGDVRTDVAAKYPDYNNESAGFHYSMDTTAFTDGEHVVNIRVTGGNGGRTVLPPQKIIVENMPE